MKINIPDYIDLNHSDKYILTIRLHPESLSFFLYNPLIPSSSYFHEITKDKHSGDLPDFKDIFYENELFALPYRKTNIVNHTPIFTFIPSVIFEEKDKEEYFNFNFSSKPDKILHQKLSNPEITIIHNMQEELYDFFLRSFVNPEFIHHFAPLICYFQNRNDSDYTHKMFINLHENDFDILCFAYDEFTLGNHFKYNHINDAFYYILFIWKQFKWDQWKDYLEVVGNATQKDILISNLKKYIQNVLTIDATSGLHFENIDSHSIPFELLALSTCEL